MLIVARVACITSLLLHILLTACTINPVHPVTPVAVEDAVVEELVLTDEMLLSEICIRDFETDVFPCAMIDVTNAEDYTVYSVVRNTEGFLRTILGDMTAISDENYGQLDAAVSLQMFAVITVTNGITNTIARMVIDDPTPKLTLQVQDDATADGPGDSDTGAFGIDKNTLRCMDEASECQQDNTIERGDGWACLSEAIRCSLMPILEDILGSPAQVEEKPQ